VSLHQNVTKPYQHKVVEPAEEQNRLLLLGFLLPYFETIRDNVLGIELQDLSMLEHLYALATLKAL